MSTTPSDLQPAIANSPHPTLDEVVRSVTRAASPFPGIAFCTLKGISSVGLKLVEAPRPALANLRLGCEDLAVLSEDLDHALARNAALLSVEGKSR